MPHDNFDELMRKREQRQPLVSMPIPTMEQAVPEFYVDSLSIGVLSPYSVRMHVGHVTGMVGEGQLKVKVEATLCMSPGHMKAMIRMLQENVELLEQRMGEPIYQVPREE